MTMDRRQFLRLTAAGAVVSLGSAACGGDAADELPKPAQPELVSVLGPETVREIGLHYREMVPGENDVGALRSAILTARPWTARLPWVSDPPLAELVRDDFTEGRTILVRGWVLSATEARQCALFSLLPS
ncbi:hypothetical protein BH23GEM4_BH23GEM4_22410 [soil metagenome]